MHPLQVSTVASLSTSSHHDRGGDLDALGERIALLAAQLQAATYRLLVMIRDFDERSGWNCGFRSCAHWLNWRTGLDLGAAREKVRVARALAELPLVSAAMERGELSFSKVRALTRVATAANEAELLVFAKAGTAAHVEKVIRGWRRVDRIVEQEHEQLRNEGRYLRAYTDEDGMVVVQARLAPEAGAALLAALDAAVAKIYDTSREAVAQAARTGDGPTAEQRRADALGLVAESALAAGLDPGTRGDRYQVVLHVEGEALVAGADAGAALIGDGARISAETSRRIACDCARVVMSHAADGRVLDVGRRTRVMPTPLRRALARRDGGCRFPGCGLRLCDAHHLKHWADGGKTKLSNLLQLCRRHHRCVHEEGFRVDLLADGEARFYRPDGYELREAPGLPPISGDPLDSLAADLARRGIEVERASMPTWDGTPLDVAWAVDRLRGVGAQARGHLVRQTIGTSPATTPLMSRCPSARARPRNN